MPTRASVINSALRLLGEPESPGLDESKKYVKRLVNAYEDCVASWFEDHDWSFASTVTGLSQVLPAEGGWDYTFNVAASCARILKVRNNMDFEAPSIDYEFRAGKILTNSETTYLKYIDRTYYEQTGGWSQKFADALSAMLADQVYPATNENNSTRDRIETVLQKRVVDAKALDARSDPVYYQPPGRYVSARTQGVRGGRYD